MRNIIIGFLITSFAFCAAGENISPEEKGDIESGDLRAMSDGGAGAGAFRLESPSKKERFDRIVKKAASAAALTAEAIKEEKKDKDQDSLPTLVEEQIKEIEMSALIRNAEALTQNRNIPYIISARDFWYRTSTVCEGLGEVFLSIAPIITFSSSIFAADDQIYVSFAGGAAGVAGLGLKKFAAISKEFGITRSQDLIEAIKQQSSDLKQLTDASTN